MSTILIMVCGGLDAVFAVAVDGRLDVNVALNRPSYQTSTLSDGGGTYLPSYANDGNHGTHLVNSPCSNTLNEVHPWWAVDLLMALYVAGVKFTNLETSGM